MSFVDPTPHRVSACPVHFIWDGRGRGRTLVRAGFLGALLAFGLAMLSQIVHVDVVRTVALAVGALGVTAWCVGHVLDRVPLSR
jgi:hypothetical protein